MNEFGQTIGQLMACGAVVSLFTLFITENERVARGCVGYLKAFGILVALMFVVVMLATLAGGVK